MTLTFLPPEDLVKTNPVLRFILMNPRWTLAALLASLALAAGGLVTAHVKNAELAAARVQVVALQAQLRAQSEAAQAIADAAELRAEAAERAAQYAREAGRADRAAAQRYLTLPVPAPEDRCEAAQALVDEAVVEARQ